MGEGEILEKATYPRGAVIIGRLGSKDSFMASCRLAERGLECIGVFPTSMEATVGAETSQLIGHFLR